MNGKKRLLKRLLAVVLISALVMALAVPAGARSKRVKNSKMTVYEGARGKLQLRINGRKVKARFYSSKKKVISINRKTGVYHAKKPGKAWITIKYRGRRYKVRVKVKRW